MCYQQNIVYCIFRLPSVLSIIDLFADTAAILIYIDSNSHYGMPRGQIHINLPPEHPIMSFETIEIKMAAVSAKRSIIGEDFIAPLLCGRKSSPVFCGRSEILNPPLCSWGDQKF